MSTFYFLTFLLNLIFPVGIGLIIFIIIAAPILIILGRNHFKSKRTLRDKNVTTVGFFHPYCNTGGGGERVLWCAIKALQNTYPNLKLVVYTGDLDASPDEILGRVRQRLNINIEGDVQFVYLHRRRWVEADRYPICTLLGQSLGSIVLGVEALLACLPDVYIDTTGYAFTLPLFKYVGGCQTACYLHYPTITSDMLRRVAHRVSAHNNRSLLARSPLLTGAKLIYYKIFAWMYARVGCSADMIMVNSSWTEDHIHELWECPLKVHRVYPPCDVNDLKSIPRSATERDTTEGENSALAVVEGSSSAKQRRLVKIVSVAQFRPEKDHPLQLRAMYQLRQLLPDTVWDRIRLVFVGACRNAEDERLVADMRDLCKHLALDENVEFKVNVSYEDLRKELQEGTIGLHAMWNEHFGIGVVECMAAGLIMVAHKSGGPRMDIIEESEGSRNGFLATDEAEYATAIATIMRMSPLGRQRIQDAARASVDRFSVEEFNLGFLRAVEPLLRKKQ